MRVEETDEYAAWMTELRDFAGRRRIMVRVDRLVHGNPGTHRYLGKGVSELKVDVGPGYRVYYTLLRADLLVLLTGGAKDTQVRDVRKATLLVRQYKEQTT